VVQDFFFPDGSSTVTIVLWALGGYGSWTHVVARVVGQSVALGMAFWVCSAASVPTIVVHRSQPMTIVFAMEALATMLEHMAVVYVIMPLLPPPAQQQHGFMFPKVKPKSDHATKAPPNHAVMHAAVTFASLHWCLWRGFGTEMNPSITLVLAYLRKQQGVDEHAWEHATMAVWGQIVGLVMCIAYTAVYFPRESKMWRSQ
jgi:hypothetical protein